MTSGGCQAAGQGKLQSRYPGVPEMGACTSGDNPWADCLGVPCEDPDGDGQAQCQCRIATSDPLDSHQYVIVGAQGEAAEEAACQPGIYYSSATPGQVFSATNILRQGRKGSSTVDPTITWIQ